MSFRSACGPTLVGLHLLPRMATPFGGDGYTIRRKGCSLVKVVPQLSPERVQTDFTIFRPDIVM